MRIHRRSVVHPRFVLYGLLAASMLVPLKTSAQSYNLRFEVMLNNGTYYDVKLKINGSASFRNGGGNICFNYNDLDLDTPLLLTAHNFSGGLYQAITVTEPLAGVVSVNVEYNGTAGNGTVVTAEPVWTDIATLRFTTVWQGGDSFLMFRPTSAPQSPTVLFDDAFVMLAGGTFINENTTLVPVELLAFSGAPVDGHARLTWSTASETNCFGYRIQRSENTIPRRWEERGFVRGSAHSTVTRHYAYQDEKPLPEALGDAVCYRLLQIDVDGSEHGSNEIFVSRSTEKKSFKFFAVYPNPVRDVGTMSLELDSDGPLYLRIFDTCGRETGSQRVYQGKTGRNELFFSVADLKSGAYRLQVEHRAGVASAIFLLLQ